MNTDPRGILRKATKIEEKTDGTYVTLNCGHVCCFNQIYHYHIGEEHHCLKCGDAVATPPAPTDHECKACGNTINTTDADCPFCKEDATHLGTCPEMATKVEKASYMVPGQNIPHLLDQIAKLNKRCAKLGIPAITTTHELDHVLHHSTHPEHVGMDDKPSVRWVPEVDIPAKVPAGYTATGLVREVYEVRVVGAAPKYAGWRFVATLEPVVALDGKETLNLVMTVPGETCPTKYMRAENVGVCEHCNAKRIRKQTFVVVHDDGTTRAVGRQCIKDFLGHTDPQKLAAWAETLIELGCLGTAAEDEGWCGGGGHSETVWDLEWYLGWVAGAVRHGGWMSRTRGRALEKRATVDTVNYIHNPPPFTGWRGAKEREEWEALKAACTPTEADKAEAAAALEWALELDVEKLMAAGGAENYLANVAALARLRTCNRKTCGLGGSIIAAAAKARDEAIKTAQIATKPASVAFGAIKARAVYRVRCDRVIPHESDFGCTYITKLTVWDDARGVYANDAVWFASNNPNMAAGKFYNLKATVKAHEEYNGRPQTALTRCVVVGERAD